MNGSLRSLFLFFGFGLFLWLILGNVDIYGMVAFNFSLVTKLVNLSEHFARKFCVFIILRCEGNYLIFFLGGFFLCLLILTLGLFGFFSSLFFSLCFKLFGSYKVIVISVHYKLCLHCGGSLIPDY